MALPALDMRLVLTLQLSLNVGICVLRFSLLLYVLVIG